ncbi:AmmeMemoRadiSam system protein B [candidate division KSB1 bacterium]|nr:AmmeMemoRadiSam system protein B [candidate division KSB1 bacterium]
MEYPKLRPIEALPVQYSGQEMIGLRDPAGKGEQLVVVPKEIFYILRFFDGEHSLLDIRTEFMRNFGYFLFEEQLNELLASLDQNLLLDSAHYRQSLERMIAEYRAQPVRPAAHAGVSYLAEPGALAQQITGFFSNSHGPGLPNGKINSVPLKGIIAPHIDVKAGGNCFAYAYKELAESEDIDLFIIIGTGHAGVRQFFACTDKDFETPFGRVATDKAFLTRLQEKLTFDIFEQDRLHQSEHVIEFQLIFLQWLYHKRHTFQIVPILSSFSAAMLEPEWIDPAHGALIREFLNALRDTIQETDKRICVIASADLAHIGPRYGDSFKPDAHYLAAIEASDREALDYAASLDSAAFRKSVLKDEEKRRICGFPPIYSMLEVIGADKGNLLKYDSVEVDSNRSVVSFASMAFF